VGYFAPAEYVDVSEEIFDPRGAKCDEIQLPSQFIYFLDPGGAAVGAPGCPEGSTVVDMNSSGVPMV
jgi:hypothetical protein